MKPIKIINITAFFAWAALISFLLYKNYAGTELETSAALKQSFDKETLWYDVYAGSKKIGFAVTTIEKAGSEIIIKQTREIKVIKNNQETLLFESLKSLCDLNYSIKSFEYSSNFKDEKGIKAIGEVDGDNVIFLLESAGKRKTHKISTDGKKFYFPATLMPVIHQKQPAPNTVFMAPVLNFANLSINEVKVVLEEVRPLKLRADILSLYKYRVGNSVVWINEKGIIIKEEFPSGMTFYSQVESIAKDPSDRIIFDYTSLQVFKSNKALPAPEKLKIMKVRIKGIGIDPLLYKNSLVTMENDIITIEKQDIEQLKAKTYTLPYENNSLNKYLVSDEWVMSDYKTIKANAHNMAVIEKNDAFRMARYLNSELYFTVSPAPKFTLSNSMDIFKSHQGDYLERTVMFASFARAAGLPVRLVSGLVYKNGYFYFHAWPEVWFDKWAPVDPSLAQFPADVTHIPLKEGSLTDIISIKDNLKNISIEILEAS
ncbi:MAG: transglutaminase-like domain-containing protein [Thermodesulfovibrionia bacterium]|nr:transglutaminase-like domain-containing protein [Thermodesulfovibrionia bacterium]